MYAPVLIPTFNRIDHLRNCLDSLKTNEQAKYTDIYISLDYTCDSRFIDGNNKIKDYLEKGIGGFKSVNVYIQQTNLGLMGNIDFLIDRIKEGYDRYILSEDDNVFSKNFLSYMNRCLDEYEGDEKVYAVCGYMWPVDGDHDSLAVLKMGSLFSAWGYGTWIKKSEAINSHINMGELYRMVNDRYLMKRLRETNRFIYVELLKGFFERTHVLIANGEVQKIDLAYSVWMYAMEKCMIYPVESKVRNTGNDGSGQNCVNLDDRYLDKIGESNCNYNYSGQKIDDHDSYTDPTLLSSEEADRIEKKIDDFFYVSGKELFRTDIAYFIYRLFGRDLVKKLLEIVG